MRRGIPLELEMRPSREVAVLQGNELLDETRPLVGGHDSSLTEAEEGQGQSEGTAHRRPSNLSVFVLVVSIGGFLFGFDTGIGGVLPFIRDDILQPYAGDPAALARWQELIVSAAIVTAGLGSIAGGWLADRVGRKRALLTADVLFAAGALAMAAAQDQWWLIAGRALVGLGVGLASVTVPIFIAECAPPARRASLVTVNVLMITTGQFCAYVADFIFSYVPGTWRWMLGIAAVPAIAQFVGLLLLPESPRWLASRGRTAAADRAMQKLQPGAPSMLPARSAPPPAAPAAAAAAGVPAGGGGEGERGDVNTGGGGGRGTPWRMLLTRPVLRALHVGVGLQILQQVAGINTVMYYTPSILQLAGVQKRAALLLSLVPSATNALGTLVGLRAVDRQGRRRLLLTSIAAVVLALGTLGSAFLAAERHSPAVLPDGGAAVPGTCPAAGVTDCTACLRSGCGFCGGGGGAAGGSAAGAGGVLAPGTCLALATQPDTQQQQQQGEEAGVCPPPHQLFMHGCPSNYTWLILACLVAYLAAFSPGLGLVPWAVNAEIYPLAVRGVATGLAATANWVSNAAVAQTFLTLTTRVGGSGAFYLYAAIASAGFVWTYACLPETNGLTLEQVQQLFGGSGSGDAAGSSSSGSAAGGAAGGTGGGSGGRGGSSSSLLWDARQQKHKRRSSGEDEGGEAGVRPAGSAPG